MKNKLLAWQTAGFVFTGIAGVLLHFLFEWTGENIIVALFSAVNESIWEHIKLLFFPMLVFALIQNRCIGSEYKNFWCIKLIGIVLGAVLIPVLYYTINGIFGMTPDWVNIAIFFIAAAVSYLAEMWLFEQDIVSCKSSGNALLILFVIALMFMVLTFVPPRIPLFQDPITKTYGIEQCLTINLQNASLNLLKI